MRNPHGHVYLFVPAVADPERKSHTGDLPVRRGGHGGGLRVLRALGCRPQTERRFLKRLGGYVVYGAILVREIIRANLAVMRVIWSRKPDYHPAIVRVHAPLEKPVSRMLLSNSITLTPGTVTVRQEGEDYLVLCLNKAHAADIPDWSLTRLLRKMEGPEWN